MIQGKAHIYTVVALGVAIIATYAVAALYYPVMYIWITYEDLYGEWTQTYLFAGAFLVSVLLAWTRTRYRWFFAALALALFYVVMEEISWGQRIIGFDTPEFFRTHNLQNEANIHNLLVGPVNTRTKQVIEYLLAGALFGYGFLYPLAVRLNWRIATGPEQRGLVAPPFYLWPLFVTAAFLEIGLLSFNEAEIAEVLVAFALGVMALHYWVVTRPGREQPRPDAARGASVRLSVMIVGLLVTATGLASITTERIYSIPANKARIDGRLLNGYEKFAGRYERYDRWDTAASLYLAVHQKEPSRTSILRRIANCYKQLGDDAQFMHYNQMALDIALKIYASEPGKVSTNLSLARTYRQRGDRERAWQHLRRANETALSRVERRPDGANEAYWLAKTYREMREYEKALQEYRRAFELKPGSTKYRKAYYDMRARLDQRG